MKRVIKGAFTLIEVMVVLSILAIIAILAYNFFGSTMKDASVSQCATKIYNDMRTVQDAMDLYKVKHGTYPPGSGRIDLAFDELVTEGYLKSYPTPPDHCNVSIPEYYYYPTFDDMDGTGALSRDGVLELYYVPDAVCLEFASKYASDLGTLRSAIWAYDTAATTYPGFPASHGDGARIFTIEWNAVDVDQCEILWVTDYNK